MKRNLIQLLTLFSAFVLLVGCNEPTVAPQELCAISLKFDYSKSNDSIINAMINYQEASLVGDTDGMEEARSDLFSRMGKCRCKMFDYTKGDSVDGESRDMPLSYCSDLIGNHRESFLVELQPYWREMRRFLDNAKKEAKKKGLIKKRVH